MENEDEDAETEISATVISYPSRRKRFLTILPLIGFCSCFYIGVIGCATLLPQYILARLRKNSLNASLSIDQCNVNKSAPLFLREQEVQQEASEITSAASFCAGVPGIFAVLVLGALSDQLGRKTIIAISYTGGCIFSVAVALLAALDLPFWVYYLASFLNGLSGSYSVMLAAIFASAADVFPPELRSTAIAWIDGSLGFAVVFSNLLVGFWAKRAGFVQPLVGLSAFTVLTGGFFLVIRETWPHRGRRCGVLGTVASQLKNMKNILCRNERKFKQILILMIVFTLSQVCWMGTDSVLTLYEMGQPFCWSSDIIGYYTAIKIAVMMTGVVVGVALLRRTISDLTISFVSIVSVSAYYTAIGLSGFFTNSLHNVLMIVAIPVGCLSLAHFATLRALCSSLMLPHEQGALFGFVAVGENFSFNFSRVIMSAIYAATVTTNASIVFFLSSGIVGVTLTLLIVYKAFFSQRMEYTDMDEPTACEDSS